MMMGLCFSFASTDCKSKYWTDQTFIITKVDINVSTKFQGNSSKFVGIFSLTIINVNLMMLWNKMPIDQKVN